MEYLKNIFYIFMISLKLIQRCSSSIDLLYHMVAVINDILYSCKCCVDVVFSLQRKKIITCGNAHIKLIYLASHYIDVHSSMLFKGD